MKIVTRQEAGEVRVGESLTVRILEIRGRSIKLGFLSEPSMALENDSVDDLSQIRCNRCGYYHFAKNGGRLLVLELTKGRRVVLNRSQELIVVEVRQAGVTLAICSGSECQQSIDGDDAASQGHSLFNVE